MIKNQTINFVFEDVRFFLSCQLQEMEERDIIFSRKNSTQFTSEAHPLLIFSFVKY